MSQKRLYTCGVVDFGGGHTKAMIGAASGEARSGDLLALSFAFFDQLRSRTAAERAACGCAECRKADAAIDRLGAAFDCAITTGPTGATQ